MVVGVYRNHGATHGPELDQGVEVWRLPRNDERLGWLEARFRLYRKVSKWAQQGKIDLIEAPDWEGWTAGWPKLPVPVVSRLHGSSCYFSAELQTKYRRSTYWLERKSLERADDWCSVSRYTADRTKEVFGLNAKTGTVIHNAVEVPLAAPVARQASEVLFSGTLTEKKGVYSLIDAWPLVIAGLPAARLHLFGKDGVSATGAPVTESLLSRLPESIRPTVQFHGHQPREQLLMRLRTARVAVFPSYAEAFALAPLESMAQGCPTIYSTRGSGSELINDGEDGLLIDPSNPTEIAAAILRVLRDDDFAQRLGLAGLARVKSEFALSNMVERNESFYSGCVERFRLHSRN